jgi:hypothetical protein
MKCNELIEKGAARAFSLSALIFLVLSGLVSVHAQTPSNPPRNPRPTPTPVLPEVVSRDADIEDMVRERTDGDASLPVNNGARDSAANRNEDTKLALDSLSAADQQKLLLYLDILTKLEQRAESLRSQLIGLTEKENSVSTKLQQIEYNLRSDVIANYTALSGSLRPESLREERQNSLEIEKRNLNTLLSQIESSRSALEVNLRRADDMAERMRTRFEAVLDAALQTEENP